MTETTVFGEILQADWKIVFYTYNDVKGFISAKNLVPKMRKTEAYKKNWEKLKQTNKELYREFQKAKKIEYKLPEFELLRNLLPERVETPRFDKDTPKRILLAFAKLRKEERKFAGSSWRYREFYLLVERFYSVRPHAYGAGVSTHEIEIFKAEIFNSEHFFVLHTR